MSYVLRETSGIESKPKLATDTELFNWFRAKSVDKRLSQSMVDGVKKMLETMSLDEVQDALTLLNEWTDTAANSLAMNVSHNGLEFVKKAEGFRAAPYQDQAGVWTIGYGNTFYQDGRKVKQFDRPLTEPQASQLKLDITNQIFSPAVNLMLAQEIADKKITQNMFDALVSICYNIGVSGLRTSSIVKMLKAGKPLAAADAFLPWNKITKNGVKVFNQGLANRRAKERALFLK